MKLAQKDIEALRKFKPTADAFSAVGVLLDTLGDITGLEQAYNEAEARLAGKRQDEMQVDARLADCAKREKLADEALTAARVTADKIKDEAHLEADDIKQEAAKTAESILERAKADGIRMRDAGKKDLQDIEAMTEKKRTEFTELADAADTKRAELAALNKDLFAAKEHIAKLLKG